MRMLITGTMQLPNSSQPLREDPIRGISGITVDLNKPKKKNSSPGPLWQRPSSNNNNAASSLNSLDHETRSGPDGKNYSNNRDSNEENIPVRRVYRQNISKIRSATDPSNLGSPSRRDTKNRVRMLTMFDDPLFKIGKSPSRQRRRGSEGEMSNPTSSKGGGTLLKIGSVEDFLNEPSTLHIESLCNRRRSLGDRPDTSLNLPDMPKLSNGGSTMNFLSRLTQPTEATLRKQKPQLPAGTLTDSSMGAPLRKHVAFMMTSPGPLPALSMREETKKQEALSTRATSAHELFRRHHSGVKRCEMARNGNQSAQVIECRRRDGITSPTFQESSRRKESNCSSTENNEDGDSCDSDYYDDCSEFPATLIQMEIFNRIKIGQESGMWLFQTWHIFGPLNISILRAAFLSLLVAQPLLRANFSFQEATNRLVCVVPIEFELEQSAFIVDENTTANVTETLKNVLQEQRDISILSLIQDYQPLFRLRITPFKDGSHLITSCAPTIIADKVSLLICWHHLIRAYRGLHKNVIIELANSFQGENTINSLFASLICDVGGEEFFSATSDLSSNENLYKEPKNDTLHTTVDKYNTETTTENTTNTDEWTFETLAVHEKDSLYRCSVKHMHSVWTQRCIHQNLGVKIDDKQRVSMIQRVEILCKSRSISYKDICGLTDYEQFHLSRQLDELIIAATVNSEAMNKQISVLKRRYDCLLQQRSSISHIDTASDFETRDRCNSLMEAIIGDRFKDIVSQRKLHNLSNALNQLNSINVMDWFSALELAPFIKAENKAINSRSSIIPSSLENSASSQNIWERLQVRGHDRKVLGTVLLMARSKYDSSIDDIGGKLIPELERCIRRAARESGKLIEALNESNLRISMLSTAKRFVDSELNKKELDDNNIEWLVPISVDASPNSSSSSNLQNSFAVIPIGIKKNIVDDFHATKQILGRSSRFCHDLKSADIEMVFALALVSVLLKSISSLEQFLVGAEVSLRPLRSVGSAKMSGAICGPLTNLLPFNADMNLDMTFKDLFEHYAEQVTDARQCAHYPFANMATDTGCERFPIQVRAYEYSELDAFIGSTMSLYDLVEPSPVPVQLDHQTSLIRVESSSDTHYKICNDYDAKFFFFPDTKWQAQSTTDLSKYKTREERLQHALTTVAASDCSSSPTSNYDDPLEQPVGCVRLRQDRIDIKTMRKWISQLEIVLEDVARGPDIKVSKILTHFFHDIFHSS